MFNLLPQDRVFYDLFDKAAANVTRAADALVTFLERYGETHRNAAEIKAIEDAGDEIAHEIMDRLHRTFITPFERSDIRRLVVAVDDIVDYIDAAASRLELYEIESALPEAVELAKVLAQAARVAGNAVRELRNLKKHNGVVDHCKEVHRLENAGDHVHHRTIAQLFHSGQDPLFIMKWKEIVEDIETAIDRCEDLVDVVEGIVIEHA